METRNTCEYCLQCTSTFTYRFEDVAIGNVRRNEGLCFVSDKVCLGSSVTSASNGAVIDKQVNIGFGVISGSSCLHIHHILLVARYKACDTISVNQE